VLIVYIVFNNIETIINIIDIVSYYITKMMAGGYSRGGGGSTSSGAGGSTGGPGGDPGGGSGGGPGGGPGKNPGGDTPGGPYKGRKSSNKKRRGRTDRTGGVPIIDQDK
jgi:hypothetical protein